MFEQHSEIGRFQDINRSLILEYLKNLQQQELNPRTIQGYLGALKVFFNDCSLNRWIEVNPHLICPEDYPKIRKTLPRYIPDDVLVQMKQNIDKLPEPVMRMVLILLECGLRIGELLTLPVNCLEQDSQGNFSIRYWAEKTSEEIIKPISLELASVIQEQQQYIKQLFQSEFNYLFCSNRVPGTFYNFIGKPEVMKLKSFPKYLNRLAKECNITDCNGKIWHFQTHQFRHTVGTQMVNNGVPLTIIQRYLGHKSPEMTMTYAYIHDKTTRQEIDKFHGKVVNISGEAVESNPELDNNKVCSGCGATFWLNRFLMAPALDQLLKVHALMLMLALLVMISVQQLSFSTSVKNNENKLNRLLRKLRQTAGNAR